MARALSTSIHVGSGHTFLIKEVTISIRKIIFYYESIEITSLIITVGFCMLHDVLYDMGIMKPPLVVS